MLSRNGPLLLGVSFLCLSLLSTQGAAMSIRSPVPGPLPVMGSAPMDSAMFTEAGLPSIADPVDRDQNKPLPELDDVEARENAKLPPPSDYQMAESAAQDAVSVMNTGAGGKDAIEKLWSIVPTTSLVALSKNMGKIPAYDADTSWISEAKYAAMRPFLQKGGGGIEAYREAIKDGTIADPDAVPSPTTP